MKLVDAERADVVLGRRLLQPGVEMMKIVRARAVDAATVTAISFAAKRSWRYPASWIQRWQDALTITPGYIIKNPTFIAAVDDQIIGFCAIRLVGENAILDHLWVAPPFMKAGTGSALFQHAEHVARTRAQLG